MPNHISIDIDRRHEFPETTLGEVYVDGMFIAYVLEDGETPDPYGAKVPKRTRIPAGTYEVVLFKSPKWHKTAWRKRYPFGMLHLRDVPGFRGIHIHDGLVHTHTDGCPLVGESPIVDPEEPARFLRSQDAMDRLYERVAPRLNAGYTAEVVITDP